MQAQAAASGATASEGDSWSRGQMLRDVRFYMLMPAILAPAFVLTAVFFHNLEIAAVKEWSAVWMTGNYWLFSVGSIVASLAAGPLIDRITAARVLPTFLLPVVLSMLIVWRFDDPVWVLPYLLLKGLTGGISHTAVTAFWAEAYGLRHLGGIRALVVSLTVFSSALGPVAMGALMDWGATVENICALMGLYCVAATALMLVALRAYGRQLAPR
jgi:MFS family permease